ncbi:alpha/beta hydrolase [Leifsonia aquatica]|uniref:alpha/beta hydrolase n=1 Tax=Leifsonia aquatica TaxID=144185 RepID=UPI0005BE87CC|nr:alpha/beta hydrolase [Leifsonia aquatica]
MSWRRVEGMGRRIGIVAGWVAGVLVLVVVGFLGWANTPMMGERPAAIEAWTDSAVQIRDAGDAVVMAPTGHTSGEGLVFIPGARVDPYAYLYKLSGAVAETGLTVVITKPTLNLAFFDTRPLSTFTSLAPDVDEWAVGGHSLGGVRACQLADDPVVKRLILFGSYCANDLSQSGLAVLSIGGEHDGLSTPAKIEGAAHLLPSDATFVEVPGMTHAQFGDYGLQPGDGTATISDDQARDAITAALVSVL